MSKLLVNTFILFLMLVVTGCSNKEQNNTEINITKHIKEGI